MTRLLLLMLASLMVSFSVFAEGEVWDEVVEVEKFHACYNTHNFSAAQVKDNCNFGRRCVDLSPRGSTDSGMRRCGTKNLKLWGEKLIAEYTRLINAFSLMTDSPEAQKSTTKLRAAQRAWLSYKDRECESYFDRYTKIGAA